MRFNRAYSKEEIIQKAAVITQTKPESLLFLLELGVLKQNLLWQLVAAKEIQQLTRSKNRMKEGDKHELCAKLFGLNVHTLRQLSTNRPHFFKRELKENKDNV